MTILPSTPRVRPLLGAVVPLLAILVGMLAAPRPAIARRIHDRDLSEPTASTPPGPSKTSPPGG